MHSRFWRHLSFASVLACLLVVVVVAQRRGGAGPDGLAFRFLGPSVGNRVASIAGVSHSTVYQGAPASLVKSMKKALPVLMGPVTVKLISGIQLQ